MKQRRKPMKRLISTVSLLLTFAIVLTAFPVSATEKMKPKNILGESGDSLIEGLPILGDSENSPIHGVKAATNDITVTVSSSKREIAQIPGATNSQVNVSVNISIGNNEVKNGKIVIDHHALDEDIKDNLYLLYDKSDWLPASESKIDRVENDGAFLTTIYLKDGLEKNQTFSMNVYYTYNLSEFERKAPTDRPIARLKFTSFNDDTVVSEYKPNIDFKATNPTFISMSNRVEYPTGGMFKNDINYISVLDTDELTLYHSMLIARDRQMIDYEKEHQYMYLLPVGTEITKMPYTNTTYPVPTYTLEKGPNNEGIDIEEGAYVGKHKVPAGKYYKLYLDLPSDQDPSSWPNVNNNYLIIQNYLKLKTPPLSSGAEQEVFRIYGVGTVTGIHNIKKTTSVNVMEITSIDHNKGIWNFPATKHFTTVGNGRSLDFTDPATASNIISGSEYNKNYHENTGTVPIKQLEYKLIMKDPKGVSSGQMKKLRFENGRESEAQEFPPMSYEFIIKDGQTGSTRTSETFMINSSDFKATKTNFGYWEKELPSYGPNEYISEIHFRPMGNGTEKGVLLPKTSWSLRLYVHPWENETYPGGQPMQPQDSFQTYLTYTYEDENGDVQNVETNKVPITYRRGGHKFLLDFAKITPGTINPGDIVEYKLNFKMYEARNDWHQPTFLLEVPLKYDFVPGENMTYPYGGKQTPVTVERLPDKGENAYYKVTLAEEVRIWSKSSSTYSVGPFYYHAKSSDGDTQNLIASVIGTGSHPDHPMVMDSSSYLPVAVSESFGIDRDKAGGYQKLYTKVNTWTAMSSASRIKSTSFPEWSADPEVVAGNNEEVQIGFVLKNEGNSKYNSMKVYNIIPYSGYSGSSENAKLKFLGVDIPEEAKEHAKIYYYHGEMEPPALNQIGKFSVYNSNWNSNPEGAKAYLIDFGYNYIIPAGGSMEIITRLETPSYKNGTQSAVVQFAYLANSSNTPFLSVPQTFTTDVYSIEYIPNLENGSIQNMPPSQSGAFIENNKQNLTVTDQVPTYTGYVFTGWNTKIDGSGTSYKAGDVISFEKEGLRNIELYPTWKPDNYDVTFVATPGSVDPEVVSQQATTHIAEPNKVTAPVGYKLAGWYTTDNKKWNFAEDTMPTNPITLTAKWIVDNDQFFTVTFDPKGGEVTPANATYNVESLITEPVATKSGYKVEYWSYDGNVWNFDANTMPAKDITLQAHWIIDADYMIKVVFNVDGNKTIIPSQEKNVESVIDHPTEPQKNGYKLSHWAYKNNKWNFDTALTASEYPEMELVAIWEKHGTKEASFDSMGGKQTGNILVSMENQILQVEEAAKEPSPKPTKTGFTFKSWNRVQGGVVSETPWNFDATLTSEDWNNIELQAQWTRNKYKVIVKPNSGTISDSEKTKEYLFDALVTEPVITAPKGYIIDKWLQENGTEWNFSSDKLPAHDITLTPQWKVDPEFFIDVVFSVDGDTNKVPAQKKNLESKVELPTIVPTKNGYEFLYWANGTDKWSFDTVLDISYAPKITLVAVWQKNGTKTATFDPTGGVQEASATVDLSPQELEVESVVKKPNPGPTKEGYTFAGWYRKTGNTVSETEWNFDTKLTSEDWNNIELVAKWKINSYTVTYTTKGGSVTPTSKVYEYNSLLEQPKETAPTGYVLANWYLVENNIVSDTPWNFAVDTMPAKDISLQATWKPDPAYNIVVSFEVDGATNSIPTQTKHMEDTIDVPVEPKKNGYKLDHWEYKGQPWNFSTKLSIEHGKTVLLKAVWAKDGEKNVTFDPAGGTQAENPTVSLKTQKIQVEETATKPSPNPTKEGHTFTGWYRVVNGTVSDTIWDFQTKLTSEDWNNIDLVAKWKVNPYVVTYDVNGGSVNTATETVNFGQHVTAPKEVPPLGYVLEGWYHGDVKWNFTQHTMPAKNITLKAKWIPDKNFKIKVTFDIQEGTPTIATQQLLVEDKIVKPINPSKNGYAFAGWKYKNEEWNFDHALVADYAPEMILVAQWTKSGTKDATFDSKGGTQEGTVAQDMSKQTLQVEQTVTEPSPAPKKPGYQFEGWYRVIKGTVLETKWNFSTPLSHKDWNNIELQAKWSVDPSQTFKVNFDPNGGKMVNPKEGFKNYPVESLVALPSAIRRGYLVEKWVLSDDATETAWNFDKNKTTSKEITLKAIWKVNDEDKFIITYNGNKGTVSPASAAYAVGQFTTKPTATYAGYKVKEWIREDTNTPWNFKTDKMPEKDIVIRVDWEIDPNQKFKVTFDPKGGTMANTSASYVVEDYIVAPTVTKAGYELVGWNYGSKQWNFGSDKMPNKDILLTAVWKVDPTVFFTVTFDPNGGTMVSEATGKYNVEAKVKQPQAKRYGYKVKQWNLGKTPWNFDKNQMPNKDITLVAEWEIDYSQTTKVTFDAMGGSPNPASQNHHVEELVAVPSNPIKIGYMVVGWNKKGETKFWNFNTNKVTEQDFPGPMVLEANWKPDPNQKFTVSFEVGKYGKVDTPTAEYSVEDPIQKPNATRNGYQVSAWKTEDGKVWDFAVDKMGPKDMTLTAEWTFDTHAKNKVIFDTNKGKPAVKDQFVAFGKKVKEPKNIKRPGYLLTGWKLIQDGQPKDIWNFATDTMDQHHFDGPFVLQAQWEVDPDQLVRVNYYGMGGISPLHHQMVIPLEELLTPPTVTRRGHSFKGWSTAAKGGKWWNFATDVVNPEPKEITLYAQWDMDGGTDKQDAEIKVPTQHDKNMPNADQKQNAPQLDTVCYVTEDGYRTGPDGDEFLPGTNPDTGSRPARIKGYMKRLITGNELDDYGMPVAPLYGSDIALMTLIPLVLLLALAMIVRKIFRKKHSKK